MLKEEMMRKRKAKMRAMHATRLQADLDLKFPLSPKVVETEPMMRECQ